MLKSNKFFLPYQLPNEKSKFLDHNPFEHQSYNVPVRMWGSKKEKEERNKLENHPKWAVLDQ